jgi:uncharacterized protein (DUF2141 family)
MKEKAFRYLLLLLAASGLTAGCAKINSPSGGPRDREIPVITESDPLNGTVNFRGEEISISFNEYVVLDKISEKFMVSPPMKLKPRVFTRGKDVRIQFDEAMRDSTTYTFYFQDAIRDLNEGNAINNFQFVVSTGPVIDSLSVTGNVAGSVNLDPPENTLMLLYSQMADSFVVKHLPDYITRAELNGEFRIDNVRPGQYRLYALKDADNSKNYNNRDEEFGFYPEPVEITPEKNYLPVKKDTAEVKASETGLKAAAGAVRENTRSVSSGSGTRTPSGGAVEKPQVKPPVKGEYQLLLFQAEKQDHYLTSSKRPLSYQMIYTLSLPPEKYKFSFRIPEVSEDKYYLENTRNRDTITVWITDSTVYNKPQLSTIVEFPFTDSLGITDLKADTIIMRYLAPRAPRTKVVRRTPYKVNYGLRSGQTRPDIRVKFTAPVPFGEADTSRISLFETIKSELLKIPYALRKDSSNSCVYFVDADLQAGKSYLFIADSAAFKSIYGDFTDSTGIKFSLMTPESFGKLTLDIKNHSGGRIIQLLDKSEKVLREKYMEEDGLLEFNLLEKGTYRIRVIFDLNGDRQWTTGDFATHRQPEPASYYPKEIEVKENWELEQDWDMGEKNLKDAKLLNIKSSGRR